MAKWRPGRPIASLGRFAQHHGLQNCIDARARSRAASIEQQRLFGVTGAFKKLQAEWYKKLADSGFQDLEFGRDAPDTTMLQHHLLDRRTEIRGNVTGSRDMMAATVELRNYATHSSLFARICTGLYLNGITESGIRAGLPKATSGAIHRHVENTRQAAERLARNGEHIEPEDHDSEDS